MIKGWSALPLTRRHLLHGASVAALAGLARRAHAAGGTIAVSNWGGDWNDRTVRFVEAPLVEPQGYRILHELALEPERKVKLLAEKRLHHGTIDVIHLNDSDAYEMNRQGVLEPLDLARIPNDADVVPALRRPYFVPWLYSGVVILYNPAKVPAPPQSYEDLWDARWSGRLGITNQLYFMYLMMAGLIKGGNMTNAESGKTRLAALKTLVNPRIYGTHQQLAAGLANGEVDLAVNYKARGLQWAHDGLPLRVKYPAEGAISITFGACLPKRAPDPDGAYVYLNAMLDRTAMAGLSEASFYAPANAKAALSEAIRRQVDFSPDEQRRLHSADYAYVSDNTSQWLEWWNEHITS